MTYIQLPSLLTRLVTLAMVFSLTAWSFGAQAKVEPLNEDAEQLLSGILEVNTVLEPEMDLAAVRKDFLALVHRVRLRIGDKRDSRTCITAMNEELLAGRKVSYLSNRYWRDCSLVAALQRRQGNCLATSTLYVAVARALKLPIQGVLVPEHIFVRWSEQRGHINIETTANGRAVTDVHYLTKFEIAEDRVKYFGWMQPLEDHEFIAQLNIIAANHLAGQQRYKEAILRLDVAIKALPHRSDLILTQSRFAGMANGDNSAHLEQARNLISEGNPRPSRSAGLLALANDAAARLDRVAERQYLMQAYALAPWEGKDEILQSLSTCLRGLRDHTGAVLCMELVIGQDPDNAFKQAWLAGMLFEAQRIDESMAMIAKARQKNPEDVWIQNMHAGLLVSAGKREEGRQLWESIKAPRTNLENYETNRAWFLAVWGDPQEFYPQFTKALSMATSPEILSWIAEDDDLDKFREEQRFKDLVAATSKRLLGE